MALELQTWVPPGHSAHSKHNVTPQTIMMIIMTLTMMTTMMMAMMITMMMMLMPEAEEEGQPS